MRRELETTWWITIIFSRRVNWKEIECFHSTVCCVIRVVDDIDDTFYSAVMRHNITHNKHALMQTNLICFYVYFIIYCFVCATNKMEAKKNAIRCELSAVSLRSVFISDKYQCIYQHDQRNRIMRPVERGSRVYNHRLSQYNWYTLNAL